MKLTGACTLLPKAEYHHASELMVAALPEAADVGTHRAEKLLLGSTASLACLKAECFRHVHYSLSWLYSFGWKAKHCTDGTCFIIQELL